MTVIVLLSANIAMFSIASKNTKDVERRENFQREVKETIHKYIPKWEKYLVNLSEESKKKIREQIDKEVEKAYRPVYEIGIENFVDYHYSVWGEYAELLADASDKLSQEQKDRFQKLVYRELFDSVGFEERLKSAYENVNRFAITELESTIDKFHGTIKRDLNITDEQTNILMEQMFQMGIADMKARLSNKFGNGFRSVGVGGGAIAGAMVTKQVAKVFSKKVATKVVVKGTSKAAGSLAGAAAGAESGVLCGPAAILCSPVGAVVGGILGWFATDAAVVSVDKYFNADDFKKELIHLVKQQQIQTQHQLYGIYQSTIEEINESDKKRLEEFKQRENGAHI